MALLPYALRPTVIIRRQALRQGILGPSRLWKAVAIWVFGKSTIKKFVGRNVEQIAIERIGANSFVNVITAAPMSNKQRKRTGVTRLDVEAQAKSDVALARAGRYANKPSRKHKRQLDNATRQAAAARQKAEKKHAS